MGIRTGAMMEAFEPHCKQCKSEVKIWFPGERGQAQGISGRNWHLRWTLRSECILTGGGPESWEGQEGNDMGKQ